MGKVYVGNDQVIAPGMVLVKDGRIVAVGSRIDAPRGATRINRPGWTITPGLIDAAASGFALQDEQISEVVPGFKVADGLNPGDRHFLKLAQEGVTTVFVTASPAAVLGCQGAVMKTGKTGRLVKDTGSPKLTLGRSASAGNRGPSRFSGITVFTRRPTSQMGVIFVARDALTKARQYAEARAAGKDVPQDVHREVLAEVLAGKRALRILAVKQFQLSAALRLAEEFGVRPVLENCVEAWRVLDALKKQKASVVMGPVIPQPPSITPRSRFFRRPQPPRMNPLAVKKVLEAGIPLALTAGSGDGEKGLIRQAEYALRHGAGRLEVLKAVTSTPAGILGVGNRVGLIKPGFDADLILWTGEPFEATSRVGRVWINGVAIPGKAF